MKKQFVGVFLASTVMALLIGGISYFYVGEAATTHVVMGVLISWLNILFYSLITVLFLGKKNVALAIGLIVIKYVLLVTVVYYIWASADVMMVLVGVFSELILTALILPPFRRFLVS